MQLPLCDQGTFEQNFKNEHTQLVWRWIASDLETPVSAYLKLCADLPNSFLLESVEGGAVLGRYSIIGFNPDLIIRNPDLESLRVAVNANSIDAVPAGLPPMAVSGLFGYIGYDNIRLIEKIPQSNPDGLGIPDTVLIRPGVLVIFDTVLSQICIVTPVYEHAHNTNKTASEVYMSSLHKIDSTIKTLNAPLDTKHTQHTSSLPTPLTVTSNITPLDFEVAVEKARDYILNGDIFQVVLSQRFETPFDLPAFQLYRSLRQLNPSPFLFFLNLDGFALVGSSPEILVRVRDNTVTIRPIAGTRPRGKTPEEDRTLASELLADPKERSEHLMLLDLGRNDVGRVARFGTVKVTEQFNIEYYSHVMHIVSNVEGTLKEDRDIVDAFFSGFPAGTVSGAPKVRAMEIIDELENIKRGYYGGGIGYFSGNGTLDTCIALRTALVKDRKLYVQAGAGIVAESDAQAEYDETVNKAKAIIRAAEMAIAQTH
jgi:anthranilate synthase component 1